MDQKKKIICYNFLIAVIRTAKKRRGRFCFRYLTSVKYLKQVFLYLITKMFLCYQVKEKKWKPWYLENKI